MPNYYKIPRLWAGKTVFLLGGGPSLLSTLHGCCIEHAPVIGINDAFRLGDWVDVCFFGDRKWYWWNRDDLQKFQGLKLTCDRHSIKNAPASSVHGEKDIHIIRHTNGLGLNVTRHIVNFNQSSGAAAVNLAFHFGASKIILIGYDMRWVDGQSNWHPHPIPRSDKPYTNFIRPFRHIACDAKAYGVSILNATPNSELPFFPFVDFEEIYESTR